MERENVPPEIMLPTENGCGKRRKESTTSVTTPNLKYVDENDENKLRGNWSGKLDFILSCLSYAVGLGNVWRFPYQCYKNGGGAFLLPFLIMLVVTGIPLFFLESAFGQYANSGVISIWKASPLFTGIGVAMFFVSFFVSIYYNVIIAWAFYYLFSSFTSELPWESCGNSWNTKACRVNSNEFRNCTSQNGSWINNTCVIINNLNATSFDSMGYNYSGEISFNSSDQLYKSPSDEFFHNKVLGISKGIHQIGSIRWQLVLCLLLSWAIVCLCMIKGIKSSGRAVYFTSTFPYLVLTILLIRGLTLPGSVNGIIYYITPKWELLASPMVWGEAAIQVFFSLGSGWGGLITLSSYNKFQNNCLRDAYIVAIGDCITSVFAGLVIFAIIGYMAYDLGVGVDKVATEGAGLAFIVYPDVVTRLPLSPLWSVLFFLMLITLGLGTQFAILNTVHTTIIDVFPGVFHKGRMPSVLMMLISLVGFILGLSCCTNGGMYVLQLMDTYSATYSVLFIALVECFVLAWIYGYDRLKADIKLMLGKHIGPYWLVTWKFISPVALVGIIAFMCIFFKPTRYEDYTFPWWADLCGWALSMISILCIPAVALYKLATGRQDLSFWARLKALSQPTDDWGPGLYRNAITPTTMENKFTFPASEALVPLNPVAKAQMKQVNAELKAHSILLKNDLRNPSKQTNEGSN